MYKRCSMDLTKEMVGCTMGPTIWQVNTEWHMI